MSTRFDVERAVLASDLRSTDRLLMLVLLTHADLDPVVIPAKFTPSLNGLTNESGLDRSTVKRGLRRLASVGWVIREPPPPKEARKGVRTRYRLAVPVGAQDTHPVGAQSAQLGAQNAQGGRTERSGVGAQDAQGGRTGHLMSNHPSETNRSIPRTRARTDRRSRNGVNPEPQDSEFEACVNTVHDYLGSDYDRRDVIDTVHAFLAKNRPDDPLAYVRRTLHNSPTKLTPSGGQPPRYRPAEQR